MKILIFFSIFITFLSGCVRDGSLIVTRGANGDIIKYHCQNNGDTLNSIRYHYWGDTLFAEVPLRDGKFHGVVKDYHSNGQLNITTMFRDGLAHGVNKVFNMQGSVIRRSFYSNNKQVLFEYGQVDTIAKVCKLELLNVSQGRRIWAGQIVVDKNNKTFKDRSLFVTVFVDDSLNYQEETKVNLYIRAEKELTSPKILIGEFDKNLECTDTLFYFTPDKLGDNYSFSYTPTEKGAGYLIGKMTLKEDFYQGDVFFFEDFCVKD